MNRRNLKSKKEQAITLIALVVTIVVLLILAGVSISMLTGENGIITQAQNSKKANKEGEIEEQVKLAVMASKSAKLGKIDYAVLNSELRKIGYKGEDIIEEMLPKTIEIDGVKVTIKEDGNTEITNSESEQEPAIVSLSRIVVTTMPTKTAYDDGDNFDPTDMVISAIYSDGSTKEITEYTIINGTDLVLGQYSVNISYTENEVTKTTHIPITFNSISYINFAITSSDLEKIGYTGVEGEELVIPATFQDTDGTWYKVTYLGTWGGSSFAGCTNLVSVTIPDSVTQIFHGFGGCTNLTTVSMPESLSDYGDGLFANCTSLKNITLPYSITSVNRKTFYGCTSLTNITIPDTVTNIGQQAFEGCTALESITLPNGVISIESSAFEECNNLTDVYYSGTEEQWNSITIESSNTALTNATIHYNSK